MEDVHTIPELGVEIRELRRELRGYVEGHDREHSRLLTEAARDHAQLTEELHGVRSELLPAVRENTDWRIRRAGQEALIKWLVGSNAAVLIGLGVMIFALLLQLSDHGAL